jgi:hypothetical protein
MFRYRNLRSCERPVPTTGSPEEKALGASLTGLLLANSVIILFLFYIGRSVIMAAH